MSEEFWFLAGYPAERKREEIREAKAANPEASNREIARQVGVDDKTVATTLRSAESVQSVEQTPHPETEQPEPAAPKASPIRQNWTLGWTGRTSDGHWTKRE